MLSQTWFSQRILIPNKKHKRPHSLKWLCSPYQLINKIRWLIQLLCWYTCKPTIYVSPKIKLKVSTLSAKMQFFRLYIWVICRKLHRAWTETLLFVFHTYKPKEFLVKFVAFSISLISLYIQLLQTILQTKIESFTPVSLMWFSYIFEKEIKIHETIRKIYLSTLFTPGDVWPNWNREENYFNFQEIQYKW
jgi:hypothetical protein